MRANTNAMRTISPRVSPNVTASYYHGGVIFVRDSRAEASSDADKPRGLSPKDLAIEADTPIALTADGPFRPAAVAVEEDARIRDVLSRTFSIPSLRSNAKTRLAALAFAVVPTLSLVAIDLRATSTARVIVDLALAFYVAFELSRATPRRPAIAALALVALALRWSSFIARLCAKDLPWFVLAAPIALFVASAVVLARIPSPSRVSLELLDKLGITRTQAREATAAATPTSSPSAPLVGFALVAAIALPALLHLMRRNGTGLEVQAIVFVAYAALVPWGARRLASTFVPAPAPPMKILWGIFAGFAITAAIMTAARSFIDTGTAFAICVDRLDAEARAFTAREQTEMANAVLRVKASALLFGLTAVVFPLAEERVYRGLLQETLVRKYGATYGVFTAAIVFGVAHVGVYQIGVYQTVLLGIAFGIAYVEGGIVAAIVVHALWNFVLLA
jgi:membrane protease YdiL (CAAX protease family)